MDSVPPLRRDGDGDDGDDDGDDDDGDDDDDDDDESYEPWGVFPNALNRFGYNWELLIKCCSMSSIIPERTNICLRTWYSLDCGLSDWIESNDILRIIWLDANTVELFDVWLDALSI